MPLSGKRTVLAMGIDHRHRRRQFVGRLMMIDDDEIEPEVVRRGDFFGIGDAAIDSDDKSTPRS